MWSFTSAKTDWQPNKKKMSCTDTKTHKQSLWSGLNPSTLCLHSRTAMTLSPGRSIPTMFSGFFSVTISWNHSRKVCVFNHSDLPLASFPLQDFHLFRPESCRLFIITASAFFRLVARSNGSGDEWVFASVGLHFGHSDTGTRGGRGNLWCGDFWAWNFWTCCRDLPLNTTVWFPCFGATVYIPGEQWKI